MAEPLAPTSPDQGRLPDLRSTMRQTMDALKTENTELGGKLFAVFGQKEEEFLLFRVPLQRQISQPDGASQTVDDFLVVTPQGFKLIRVDEGAKASWPEGGVRDLKEQIERYVKYGQDARMKGIFNDSAYHRRQAMGDKLVFPLEVDGRRVGFSFEIGPHSTIFTSLGSESESMRLVNADPKTVPEIGRINQERIKEEIAEEARNEEIRKANVAVELERIRQQEPEKAQPKVSPEDNIAAAQALMEGLKPTTPT